MQYLLRLTKIECYGDKCFKIKHFTYHARAFFLREEWRDLIIINLFVKNVI